MSSGHMKNYLVAALILGALTVLCFQDAGYAAEVFKLKTGAKKEACLECHPQLKETLKQPYVHPLLKTGECIGCHTPHTSSMKNLLTAETTQLCIECHAEVLPQQAHSVHGVVVAGECRKCHDAHGSSNAAILLKPGNELCFDCHQDIGGGSTGVRFRHPPVYRDNGCLNCHNSHASEQLPKLLKKEAPALCAQCHKTTSSAFAAQHLNYDVSDADCTSCHNPHGSDKQGLFYDVAHRPLEEKNCAACHPNPARSGSIAVESRGVALCLQCHEDMINASLEKDRVHWPMLDRDGCLNCHSPHATKHKKLVKGPTLDVCGACHADTVKLQALSKKNPKNDKLCEPVRQGECVVCHLPHAGDGVLMFKAKTSMEWCGECHAWQAHSSHPIGEKVIDPRNKNLTLDCLSCHRGCGTANNPMMLEFATTYDLCVSCHVERRR
jgi:DmsE family decaheme c-type cytochrome